MLERADGPLAVFRKCFTVAGQVASGDFAYVSLDDPCHITDLGFKARFVRGLLT